MKKNIAARVLGVLGLVLLLSTFVTFLFGQTQFVAIKAALGVIGIAAGLTLGGSGGVKRFFTGRAAHFGFFTAVSALLVVAILAAANFVAYRRPKTWDLTKNKIFTLSEDTTRTLKGLKTDVKALAFYRQDEDSYPEAQDLLKRYANESSRFRYQFVDPYKEPELVRQYSVTEGGARIVLVANPGAAEPGTERNKALVKDTTEQALTNALVQVTRSGTRKLYFTEGHGEPDPHGESPKGDSTAVRALENEGFQVASLSLLQQPEVPADAAVVMVAAPRKAFLDPELKALREYLDKGGRVAIFLEPEVKSGLEGLLKDYGIEPDDDMVVDPSPVARLFGGSPVTPIVQPSAQHEITRDLARVGVALPTVRSLVALTGAHVTPTPIALSGTTSWGETDVKSLFTKGARYDEGKDKRGPLPVAMAAAKSTVAANGKRTDEARLLVVGDGEFFSNQYGQLLGNMDFFLNGASWLGGQEDRITIRPRSREASRLFLTEAQVAGIKFLTIDALPVALLGLGLAVWLVRRSK